MFTIPMAVVDGFVIIMVAINIMIWQMSFKGSLGPASMLSAAVSWTAADADILVHKAVRCVRWQRQSFGNVGVGRCQGAQ